jgi:DNA-binding response OmpR family regulator
MKILVVEDDALVAKTLEILFSSNSYAIDLATDAESALQMIEAFEYDLVLLDFLLPGLDGISLCQKLRNQGYQMPILLLTGQDSTHQKAIALNNGADDYVVKPFASEELLARVQALLRRGGVVAQPIMEWGALRLNPSSREVTYDSYLLSLTPKEYALLELFLRNNQRILSSKAILEHAWTSTENPGEETVRVHIKGLRKKLKTVGAPADFIETVHRVGYRLKPIESLAINQHDQPVIESDTRPVSEVDSAKQPSPNSTQSSENTVQPRVMLVTVDSSLVARIKKLLEPKALQIIFLSNLDEFWKTLASCDPHALILDSDATNGKSVELCQTIRNDLRWQRLPILFLIGDTNKDLVNQIFAAGADDFVSQPIIGPELVARVMPRLIC